MYTNDIILTSKQLTVNIEKHIIHPIQLDRVYNVFLFCMHK